MSNHRWALPTTIIIALLVAGGLLFQTQQLSNTQTDLTAARESIAQLEASATQQGDALIVQATAAAATEVALLDSAAATQSALQANAATAQAQAEATQSAQTALIQDTNALLETQAVEIAALHTIATLQAATVDALDQRAAQLSAENMALQATLTAPRIVQVEPAAPIEVGNQFLNYTFADDIGRNFFEGDISRQGRLDVVDGVYRFAYTVDLPDITLSSRSIADTEVNQLLEIDFRILGCKTDTFGLLEVMLFASTEKSYSFFLSCGDEPQWGLVRYGDDPEAIVSGTLQMADGAFRNWHTISLATGDSSIKVYLDGVELGEGDIAVNSRGDTALRVYARSEMTFEFDNLRTWELVVATPRQLHPVGAVETLLPSPTAIMTATPDVQQGVLDAMIAQIPERIEVTGSIWQVTEIDGNFSFGEDTRSISISVTNADNEMGLFMFSVFPDEQSLQDFWAEGEARAAEADPTPVPTFTPPPLVGFPDGALFSLQNEVCSIVWTAGNVLTWVSITQCDESMFFDVLYLARWVRDSVVVP